MSAQDYRDMLGITGDVPRPPPLKKQKTVEKRTCAYTVPIGRVQYCADI